MILIPWFAEMYLTGIYSSDQVAFLIYCLIIYV